MTHPSTWLRGRRVEWACTAVLVAVAVWYWLQFFTRSTNLLDEGSTAAQALRILKGDVIYRDFFTVVTPLSYYTIALLLKIFGLDLLVLRWAALVTGIGILLATLFVTRRLASWPFAAGAALLTTVWGWFLVTPNFYSLQASLFVMLALLCYLRGSIFAAGVLVGLAALTKQNVGAYAAIALLLTIWLSRLLSPGTPEAFHLPATPEAFAPPATPEALGSPWQRTRRFVAGICAPVIPALFWLIAAGAGPYLYESWIYYPIVKYPARFALAYPKVAGVLAALPDALTRPLDEPRVYEFWAGAVLQLPLIVYPLSLALLVFKGLLTRQRARPTPEALHTPRTPEALHTPRTPEALHQAHALLAVTVVGAFTLLQAWPRADATHILFGMPPTYALLAYLLSRLPRVWHENTDRRPGRCNAVCLVFTAIALIPIVLLLTYGYKRTKWEYQNYIAGLHVEGGRGISTLYVEAQRIDTVTKYIADHTRVDDHIFVVPWAAGFYFLTDRENPTRTDFMLFEDPEAYPCLIARLDQKPPKYVIYGYTWDVDEKRFRDYAAPIDRYIRSHYAIEFTTDGYEIWRRINDAATDTPFKTACRPRSFRLRDLLHR